MKLITIIVALMLLGVGSQTSATPLAVVDLANGEESLLVTDDATKCVSHCLEIHRIGGYALLVLRDDDGHVSSQVLPWLDDVDEYGLDWNASGARSHEDASAQRKPLTGSGGNCAHEKVNCVETFIVPSGYVVAFEYGPDGKIKTGKYFPVLKAPK